MIINNKTRDLRKYLDRISNGQAYRLGRLIDEDVAKSLEALGFASPFQPGESRLPSGAGKGKSATRRNADGYTVVMRDQPMETAFRQIVWQWEQFCGRGRTETRTGMKDVPYRRYPRRIVPPYGIELEIRQASDGRLFVTAGTFVAHGEQDEVATNTANMLVELFGGFETLDSELSSPIAVPVRRVNWQLLPRGRSPWESARPVLAAKLDRMPEGKRNVLLMRLEAIGERKPSFVAVGLGGFGGYTVFGFEHLGICVLESPHTNNATYVLSLDSWEAISQLSKADILNADLHRERLIHTEAWMVNLNRVLSIRSSDGGAGGRALRPEL